MCQDNYLSSFPIIDGESEINLAFVVKKVEIVSQAVSFIHTDCEQITVCVY